MSAGKVRRGGLLRRTPSARKSGGSPLRSWTSSRPQVDPLRTPSRPPPDPLETPSGPLETPCQVRRWDRRRWHPSTHLPVEGYCFAQGLPPTQGAHHSPTPRCQRDPIDEVGLDITV
eukprot:1195784-Prorocentrum_minimum.AAC.2